ncbi:MAG: zinc-ribbon domain-containing protein [Bacteroidota bacterium]
MICNNCGYRNSDNARFCAYCGAALLSGKKDERTCTLCGAVNPMDAHYCANCGSDLRAQAQRTKVDRWKKKKGQKVEPHKKWYTDPFTIVLITAAVAVIGAIFYAQFRSKPQRQPVVVEQKSSDPVLERKVTEIAAKFVCSCGRCNETSLDICTCPKAIEERQFIRSSLQQGIASADVVSYVNGTFGGLKPEFQTAIDRSGAKKSLPKSLSLPTDLNGRFGSLASEPNKEDSTKIATVADRSEIFSHFKCPCGQCAIYALQDCNCTHPRGALEVKSFVDGKISENKFTIAQIISMVQEKYGGRIF